MTELDAINAARERYALEQPRYTRASTVTAAEVHAIASRSGIGVEVSGRSKSLASFVKKAVRKHYVDPWHQITDKAGVRAVVGRPADVDRLVVALNDHLGDRVLDVQDGRDTLDVQALEYAGVHVQVAASPEDGDSERVECEVQVRTAAQDVWSVLSHRFLYKPTVDAPRRVQRALWRLIALVEIIDEEVDRAVTAILSDPDYPQAQLLHQAEEEFLQLTAAEYDSGLSLEVLAPLVNAIAPADRAAYGDTLSRFVESRRDDLERFFADYGPASDLASQPRYILATQPEVLVLFERAESHAMLLENAVTKAGSDLRRLVEPVLIAWGKPLPG